MPLAHDDNRLATRRIRVLIFRVALSLLLSAAADSATASENPDARESKGKPREAITEIEFPPRLPDGQHVVTDMSEQFLEAPATLDSDVAIAKAPPTVDFLYYPGQTYEGRPWSNWGDGVAAGGKYYSAIGNHLAIGAKGNGEHGTGTALVFEYDPGTKMLRKLIDVAERLAMPPGHYTPGKIHSRLDEGRDGWIYFATHRGSVRSTTEEYHYLGDWILRAHPQTGRSEVVSRGPVPGHSIPTSVLDPDRMIFYGGTAAGIEREEEGTRFFAYDLPQNKLLFSGPDGPARYLIFARSTGRVYYVPGKDDGPLMRFDPATDQTPVQVEGSRLGVRSATQETPDGFVYTVSSG